MSSPKIICGIYRILNTVNGKSYIGLSVNIHGRWKGHTKALAEGQGNIYLVRAIRKHGLVDFDWVVLEECAREDLNERETYWINHYRTYVGWDDSNGYNLTTGGEGGFEMSPETRAKISVVVKKQHTDPVFAARQSAMMKKRHTDPVYAARHSARTSAKMKKWQADPVNKAKISTAAKKRNATARLNKIFPGLGNSPDWQEAHDLLFHQHLMNCGYYWKRTLPLTSKAVKFLKAHELLSL